MTERQSVSRRGFAIALVALLLVGTGVGVVAASTASESFNTTGSELSNASRTNMPVQGTGDDAVVTYDKPDVSESTNSEFENGSLSGSAVVANDAVEYDGWVVGSQHSSPEEFDQGTLTNLTTTGSGDSGSVVLETGSIVADFESDLSNWNGDTDAYSTTTQFATNGDQGLHATVSNSSTNYLLFSTSGLDTYPSAGQTVSADVQLTDTDDLSAIYFGVQDNPSGAAAEGYRVELRADNNGVQLLKGDGSSSTTLESANADLDQHLNERLTVSVDWGTDGSMNVSVEAADGTVLASFSASDSTYTDGGVGVRSYNFNQASDIYYDYYRLNSGPTDSAQYVSPIHNVSNAEEAAINITQASNVSVEATVRTDGGTTLNQTTITSTSNHTLTLADTSSESLETVLDVDVTGSNPELVMGDESILSTKQASYTTQTYTLENVSGASIDLGLPNATATIDWQASADGSTWVTQETTSYSTTGTFTPSFSGDYEYWRANLTYTYDGGDGTGSLQSLTWDAPQDGTYVGQTHSVANASYAFLALTNQDANTTVTVQGYDNETETWETAGNQTYTSSVFSTLSLNGSYAKYRTRLNVTSSGSPTVELHSEGVTTSTTVVEETVVEESTGTTLVTAISEPEAASASLISDLPLDLLPDYLAAEFTSIIQSWFGGFFGDSTEEANAQTEASQAQSYYNDNSDAFTSWLNSQTADQDVNLSAYDTIKVTFAVNDENATRYVIGLVDNDRYATTTVVNSTDRTVDQTLVLRGRAAVDADSTLETMHSKFVESGDPISREYQTELAATYGDGWSGTLVNTTAEA